MNKYNEVYTAQGLAFDKIMPANYIREFGDSPEHVERIPYGAEMDEDGNVYFVLHAPNAKSVEVICRDLVCRLERKEEFWEGTANFGYGYKNLNIVVDGNEIIYPLLPIGFGFSRPVNYIDVPEPGVDFFAIKDVPHGAVCTETYFSKVTGRYERCLVYLPPEYGQDPEKEYPVLYLQHGHGENENCWVNQGKMNYIYDNLLAEGKAVPTVVVMANGMVQMEKNGQREIDSRAFEVMLLGDIVPFIERRYRVKKDRENRAMAGLSMGSMQTSVITFKHQDMFAYSGLFSGFLRDVMNEDVSHLDDRYAAAFSANMKLFFRAMGDEDEFQAEFQEDDRICEEKGIESIRRIYKGGHEWSVWRECLRDYAMMLFQ